MLLKTVQSQLSLIIDEDFEGLQSNRNVSYSAGRGLKLEATYVRHELLASNTDFLSQRCAEHHDLLVMGSRAEDFLNVAAHVWCNGFAGEMIVHTYGTASINAGVKSKRREMRNGNEAPGINMTTVSLRLETVPSCRQLIRQHRSRALHRRPLASSTLTNPVTGPADRLTD